MYCTKGWELTCRTDDKGSITPLVVRIEINNVNGFILSNVFPAPIVMNPSGTKRTTCEIEVDLHS